MKPNVYFLLICLVASALLVGCGDDDGETGPALGSAFIVQNTVQAPDAPRTVFLSVVSNLTDEIDLADAFEFNGGSRARVFNGQVYVFDSENLVVIKHNVDENNLLVEEDRFSVSQLGAASFNSQIAFVNDEYALVLPNGLRQFVIWNPTTMAIRSTIDFPSTIPDPFNTSNIGSINVSSDGKVYMGMAGLDFQNFSNVPGARVTIVDPVTEEVDVIFDETIAAGTEGAFDGDGNYYFNANGYFGLSRYIGIPQDAAQTMTRINQGEEAFDPNFNIATTSIGDLGLPQSVTMKMNGDAFLAIMIDQTDEELQGNPFTLTQEPPVKLLLGTTQTWESAVEVPFSDGLKSITDIFVIDGSFYGVAREFTNSSAESLSDIYRISDSGTLEKQTEGVGWIEYIARVR
ncbi:MAG: hypothetical protein AAGA85_24380 [Bacteroidota bacterium]